MNVLQNHGDAVRELQKALDKNERLRKALDDIAPAVENLACHQEQCGMDGVMVKVSRQALDEVLGTINALAILSKDGEAAT